MWAWVIWGHINSVHRRINGFRQIRKTNKICNNIHFSYRFYTLANQSTCSTYRSITTPHTP